MCDTTYTKIISISSHSRTHIRRPRVHNFSLIALFATEPYRFSWVLKNYDEGGINLPVVIAWWSGQRWREPSLETKPAGRIRTRTLILLVSKSHHMSWFWRDTLTRGSILCWEKLYIYELHTNWVQLIFKLKIWNIQKQTMIWVT